MVAPQLVGFRRKLPLFGQEFMLFRDQLQGFFQQLPGFRLGAVDLRKGFPYVQVAGSGIGDEIFHPII